MSPVEPTGPALEGGGTKSSPASAGKGRPADEARNAERIEIRVHGSASAPTLVYLPGIHGDWYLATSFRQAVQGRVRFVEFCYPRTTTWTLRHHAGAVLGALQDQGIDQGWLVAESFGSQVGWSMLESGSDFPFRAQGLILAGGFVRYPWMGGVRLAANVINAVPAGTMRSLFRVYTKYARFRHRQAPETLASLDEFVRRRLEPGDREAILHRLTLIAGQDPRACARAVRVPTWSLTGFWDPIVPWWPVRRWLRRECPGWRGDRILPWADHTVLATQPRQAAEMVLGWMTR